MVFRGDNNGRFNIGVNFSHTEADHNYTKARSEKIANTIKKANAWDDIVYENYDWSKVNYKNLSNYATEKIDWTKVDLELF